MAAQDEREPLVKRTSNRVSIYSERDPGSLDLPQGSFYFTASGVTVQKHLTLTKAIAIMAGSVAGSAIFIAPTGVLKATGSVGASLTVWGTCGLLNLIMALCYAELGSAIPVAGGDYAYIYQVMGKFPAFMCLWIMVVLIAPVSVAFVARTFGTYFTTLFTLECQPAVVVVSSLFLIGKCIHATYRQTAVR